MALDKYQEIDQEQPFSFETNIYGGDGGGGSYTTLPVEDKPKWQPTIAETVAAPVADTAVVLPAATQPQNEVATTSVPKVISIIQGAVNGIANAVGANGTPATPPFVAPSSNEAALNEATRKTKQKAVITILIVLVVVAVLSYFAFKKK